MPKMVMIAYNEALDIEVMEIVGRFAVKNYTKIPGAFGRGTHSGTHEGNDIWPGRNSIIYVACDEKQAKEMLEAVRELRSKVSHEGIKAFILPVEEAT